MGRRILRLAIVGGGPRGLAAAEALRTRAEGTGSSVELTMFEPHPAIGAGPHHDPSQTPLNRLNIPLRAIDIAPAGFAGAHVGSFQEWAGGHLAGVGPDDYPSRRDLGRFLTARWHDLVDSASAQFDIAVARHEAKRLMRDRTRWRMETEGGSFGPFDEVLLTPGHQPVEPDLQLERWRSHAQKSGATLITAYPSDVLMASARNWRGHTVAIRGLALSMIDVMRALTIGQGGRFVPSTDGLRYEASGLEPARLLPFSLDGVPPAPKPASAKLDAVYDPDAAAIRRFKTSLAKAVGGSAEEVMALIGEGLAALSAQVFERFGGKEADIARWLATELSEEAEHAAEDRPPASILADHLAMALGRAAPSPGYVVGQVWRKLQNSLRRVYNPAEISGETATALVRFDEGMKRFSYGPPALAAAEMLALARSGLLDLRAVDDPDIAMVQGGWRLSGEKGEATAKVMVDSVLPSPELAKLSGPLLADLRKQGLLSPVGTKLGARTTGEGCVLDASENPVRGLSMLGRLALGSVIATDSVHDCFGASVGRWADGVLWSRKTRQA